jgi:putative transposase
LSGDRSRKREDPCLATQKSESERRWVRSVKEECLAKLILLGEGSLRRALRHYEAHYHEERNHQGKNNVLLFALPTQAVPGEQEKVRCRERLGGLLKYYEREAA